MTPREVDEPASSRFAKRLNAAIETRGVSHRALAKEIGASKQSVTNWTQGRNEPSLRHLRNIARVLDVPVVSLLQENDKSRPVESQAASLMKELTNDPIGPAIRALSSSAPDLLDLLSRAESYVRGLEGREDKS